MSCSSALSKLPPHSLSARFTSVRSKPMSTICSAVCGSRHTAAAAWPGCSMAGPWPGDPICMTLNSVVPMTTESRALSSHGVFRTSFLPFTVVEASLLPQTFAGLVSTSVSPFRPSVTVAWSRDTDMSMGGERLRRPTE